MRSTLTNFSNYLESNLKVNGTLDYLSNVFEEKLKQYQKPRSSKKVQIKDHLVGVCNQNTPVGITIEGSYLEYQSIFVKMVEIEDAYGFLVDMLMPRDGNYRMEPNTNVTFSYTYGGIRYKFETLVISYIDSELPTYLIKLPKAIKSNEKRMHYRMPTTILKPLTLERKGDRIRNAIIKNSRVLDFSSEGLCLELPPVEMLKNGKKFLRETLQQIVIRLPDSTSTLPINASCCHLSTSISSNRLICGIRFEDISASDRNKLMAFYYERQHDVRVA